MASKLSRRGLGPECFYHVAQNQPLHVRNRSTNLLRRQVAQPFSSSSTSGNGITPVAFRTVLRHPARIVNLTFVPLLVVRNKVIRLESFLARLQGLKKIVSVSNGGNHNFLQSTVGNVNVPPVLEDKAQQW
jgi:hypothetical protein